MRHNADPRPIKSSKKEPTKPTLLSRNSFLRPIPAGSPPAGCGAQRFLTYLRSRFGSKFFTGSSKETFHLWTSSQQVIHSLSTENGPAFGGAKHPEPNRNGAECPESSPVAEISASVLQILFTHTVRYSPVRPFFAEFSRQVPFPLRGKGTGATHLYSAPPTPGVLRPPGLERYPLRSTCNLCQS